MDCYFNVPSFFLSLLRLNDKLALVVGCDLDMDAHSVIGEEGLDEFWPLDKAEIRAVEVIFVTDVIYFGNALNTVKVEVIEGMGRLSGSVGWTGQLILVDDGEGGGVDDIGNAKLMAYGGDECGFSSSHLSVEGEVGRGVGLTVERGMKIMLNEILSGTIQLLQCRY